LEDEEELAGSAADATGMAGAEEGIFTRFVRQVEPGADLEPALFAVVWSALGRVLRQELRRRSLAQASPRWLGIYGFPSWWEVPGRSGPLEELLADCYQFVFVERLAALKAQTLAKANIDGVVLASVRNFLHDRHRLHDRLGTRLFEVLSLATRRALDSKDLTVVGRPGKLTNATVLAIPDRASSAELASPEALAEVARRWSDQLFPDLLTAVREDKRRLIEDLARRLADLELAGIAAFRFGDLIAPLRADARGRWAAMLEPAEEEPPEEEDARGYRRLRLSLRPTVEAQVVAADRFAKLMDCVDSKIEANPASERTRRYLRRLLLFLRAFATDGEAALEDDEPGAGRLPSFRRLADLLEIPRERLRDLMRTLGGFVERCRELLDGEGVRTPARAARSGEIRP
jgi:hypothetical protein